MPADLHSRISSELSRRLEVAKAAGGDEWHQTDPDREFGRIEDAAGNVVVYDEGAPTGPEADHIALHDPADSIRRYTRDLAVLEQHAPTSDGACSVCLMDTMSTYQGQPLAFRADYPCDEITLLAASLGLDTEGSTTDG